MTTFAFCLGIFIGACLGLILAALLGAAGAAQRAEEVQEWYRARLRYLNERYPFQGWSDISNN